MDDAVLRVRPDFSDASDLPVHARIGYWLERLIASRTLLPGDRLPSEVDIATALGVSRMTLRQALAGIEAKGLLERRRGRFGGSFVAEPRFDYTWSGCPASPSRCVARTSSRAATSSGQPPARPRRASAGPSGCGAASRCTRWCGCARPTASR